MAKKKQFKNVPYIPEGSKRIRLEAGETYESLSQEEIQKRIVELGKQTKSKVRVKNLTKKQKALTISQREEETALLAELEQVCNTLPDVSRHPYELPNGPIDKIKVKAFMKTYLENVYRNVNGLSDYQLAVVDNTGKIIMTSIITDVVLKALFDIRSGEYNTKKETRNTLDKAIQEPV